MKNAGVTTFCEYRLALFALLQRAYAAPVTPELADDLTQALSTYAALTDLDLPANSDPPTEAEFNRLFVGPGKLPAPPYESVWQSDDRLLVQSAMTEVRSCYRAHGVQNTHPEPDDHLALELEFYTLLQRRFLDGDRPAHQLAAQHHFLTHHLSIWLPAFCEAVQTHAASPFYRNLAESTLRIIQLEKTILPMLQSAISAEEESAHAHA
ncbi:MAG: dmsD 1 [Symbiobacteriaceae bacterium]|jgi:TorA maturation chaperone TorD|nr:dmsD 1 [Symbiobacteriaceae bacterium]